MGRDATFIGTGSELTPLKRFISSWNITETGASTAYVKFRDSIAVPGAVTSAADGAAGNVTVGLHMIAVTFVTRHGESLQGPLLEFTAAGSKIASLTGVPLGPATTAGATFGAVQDIIVGRRIYVTKAGAPATTVTPTNAQWFLVVADLSTTIAAGMNNKPLAGNSTLTVADTTGFAASGNLLVTTTTGVQPVSYSAIGSGTTFTGVTMLRPAATGGYLATSNAVTQPMLGDNTTTTYSWNVADGSLTATNPPTKDTAGARRKTVKLASGESAGDSYGSNVVGLSNNGGLYVEVNSGTVEWSVTGT